jgi:hypothetical protein
VISLGCVPVVLVDVINATLRVQSSKNCNAEGAKPWKKELWNLYPRFFTQLALFNLVSGDPTILGSISV